MEHKGNITRCTVFSCVASGFAVGIYTTNSPDACQYVAENCKANIIVVENHKQLQKILQVSLEDGKDVRWFYLFILLGYRLRFSVFLDCGIGRTYLKWVFFLQVQDKLPHLKAIIQYKDALKEKRPNLYTVWMECQLFRFHLNNRTQIHAFCVFLEVFITQYVFCRFVSPPTLSWMCLPCIVCTVGWVYGAGSWWARHKAGWHHRYPEAQPVLHTDLHFWYHRPAQRSDAQPRQCEWHWLQTPTTNTSLWLHIWFPTASVKISECYT